jgi:hypothetical protein
MKKTSTPLYNFFLLLGLLIVVETNAQDVGIGTQTPDHKLHISSNTSTLLKLDNTSLLSTGVMSDLYFKTGQHYTGAIKTIGNGTVTARLGLFTYATTNPTALLERMSIMDDGKVGIGTNTPGFLLDVNGRVRVRHSPSNTAGVVFMDAANANNSGFVGMKSDSEVGFYGFDGGGWGLTMNTSTGDVSILGSQLYVTSGEPFYTASFTNTSGNGHPAVLAQADNVAGVGVGVHSEGGETGIYAIANQAGGTNHRYGIECYGQNGSANNYGIYASGAGGNNAYGIYATAFNGTTNWGGYFSGSVYTTGSYQGSDRKLKSDVRPLDNAIQLIQALKPSTYLYKSGEYEQMALPEGQQYGLIADEVKQVFPSMVKTALQPAKYENDDRSNGRMLAEEVSFEAVNYTAMIPVLIAAMQEQ